MGKLLVVPVLGLLTLAVCYGQVEDQRPIPVVGLLEVPGLFRSIPQPEGGFVYADTLRRELEVYASPNARAEKRKITQRSQLLLREHAYEGESLAVLGESGSWFRIALPDGSGWIRTPPGSRFRGLEELLAENLSYVTKEWDGRLWADPRDPSARRFDRSRAPGPEPVAKVLASQWIDGALWVQIQILDGSICEVATPRVLDSGWTPAHSPSGAANLWFHSRGC